MGYACPVCEEPQQDAAHLANHLAFQAMIHGDDHESWLDDHVPDWATSGPAELAPRVASHADETEYEVVFDDTTPEPEPKSDEQYDPDLQGEPSISDHGHGDGHGHRHDQRRPVGRDGRPGVGATDLGPEAQEIVDEARELTREMFDDEDEDGDGAGDEGDE